MGQGVMLQRERHMRSKLTAALLGVSLVQIAGCPTIVTEVPTVGVRVTTTLGDFVIELYPEDAPTTVDNFLEYVDDGFYDGTVFHRVIADFVVQGGGLTPDLIEKETRPPIMNESFNGLTNTRASVAMARTGDPDSATVQFFVNLKDNLDLDATSTVPGYAVFGRVIEGMDVVDSIAAVPTEQREGLADVPVEDVVIENIQRTDLPPRLEVTPEGEAYLEDRLYRLSNLARDYNSVHEQIRRPNSGPAPWPTSLCSPIGFYRARGGQCASGPSVALSLSDPKGGNVKYEDSH
jgi:peptidyl-prolyl cis-trans isomerase A (cyclophilin A)